MKKLIVIVNLLFLSLASFAQKEACRFNPKFEKIYSLSGPLTMALSYIGLLQDKKLAGISIFHPVPQDDFHGEILPGGLFLSRQVGVKLVGSLVIYDKGEELKKMLNQFKIDSIEVNTLGLLPLEVSDVIEDILQKITTGCEIKIENFKKYSNELSEQILKVIPKTMKGIFFLGKLSPPKFPEMMMVQDGVLKWLIKKKVLVSYPTELAYLPWSAKIMNSHQKDFIFIGVKDSGREMVKELTPLNNNTWNFSFPGALIPGISQLEAWLYLFKNLKSI